MGRLRLEREEVRADLVADRGDLRLGRLLRSAREGRNQRNLEDRLLLRIDQGRLHRHRALRPRVSAKTKAAIGAKRAALISGKFYEFTGPLYDQKGKLRVPAGKKLTVKDLYAQNWLVKGVIGSPKG